VSTVAIIGAGPLGGALARSLAGRGRVGEVRLIDPEGRVAEGKALDILQSSPVEPLGTRVTGATTCAAAAGAGAIVLADLVSGGEIAGEPGLALLRQLARRDVTAPFLFTGGLQRELMIRALAELHLAPRRLLGSAPLALESAVRAVTAALMDASPADLSIGVAGGPPRGGGFCWGAGPAFPPPPGEVVRPPH